MEGEEAAWQDLEEVYLPAANAGLLPLRIYAFVALPTWCARRACTVGWAPAAGKEAAVEGCPPLGPSTTLAPTRLPAGVVWRNG